MKRFARVSLALTFLGFGTAVLAAKPQPPPAGPAEIAFSAPTSAGQARVMVMDHLGNGIRTIYAVNRPHCNIPDWSPDGKYVLAECQLKLRVIDVATGNSCWVEASSANELRGIPARFHPLRGTTPGDPYVIAFTNYRNGPVEAWVYAFRFQAGDRCPIDWTQQLTNTPELGEFGVAWSPDGTKLATLVSAEEYPENLNPHVLRIHNLIQDGTGRIQLDPTSPYTDHSLSDEVDISLSDYHSGRTLQWSRVEPNILGFAALSYATGLLDVYRFDLGRGYPEKFSQLGGSGCVDGAPFDTTPCFFDFTNTPSTILRNRDDGIYSETPWAATPILLNGRTEYGDPAWNPTAP